MTDRTGIGGNMPPAFDAFSMALDDVYTEAKNWLDGAEVENQAQADAIGTIMATARRIRRDADQARADEKRPHDEAAKSVQEKWRPLLTRADNIVSAANKPLTAFLEAQEAKRRAEAEDALVEALRLQTEAQRARQASDGNLTALEGAEALQKAADATMKAASKAARGKAQVAGMDRAIGLRTIKVAVVTNRRTLLEHVMRTDPDALGEWLAEYAHSKLPAQLPGVEIQTVRRAA